MSLGWALRAPLVVWLAVTLAFVALRLLPGDAIDAQLAQVGAGELEIAQRRAQLGLDAPPLSQYGRFWAGLLVGDWGVSLSNGQPVLALIAAQLPPTLTLALSAATLASLLGVTLGTLAALGPDLVRAVASGLLALALGAPIYWTGTLVMVLFAAQWGWLPATGSGSAAHLVLPVSVLAFHTMGEIGQVTRANVSALADAPYVRYARSRGLPESLIARRHVLRVALSPVMAVIALQIGFLLGGTVITESLFARPGLGRLLLDSVLARDFPVVQGLVMLAALVYVTLNAAADLAQSYLDPRLRREPDHF